MHAVFGSSTPEEAVDDIMHGLSRGDSADFDDRARMASRGAYLLRSLAGGNRGAEQQVTTRLIKKRLNDLIKDPGLRKYTNRNVSSVLNY